MSEIKVDFEYKTWNLFNFSSGINHRFSLFTYSGRQSILTDNYR